MMWFVTRSRHDAETAALKAEADRQRRRAENAEGNAATAVYNREQTLRQNAELQRRLDAAHDNQLSESAEATRLDAEHDARRQALADALGAGPDQSWDELIKLASRGTGASREEIEAWDARARAHDRWLPPADLDKRPIGGGTSRPTHPADELRRTQERCLALEARLAVAEGRTRKAVSGS